MKQLILPALLLLFCSMIQPTDCSRFRNGKFKSTKGFLIERNGDFQREYGPDSGVSVLHVKWLSDCTYTLVPTEESLKNFPGLPKDAVLTCEIIKTTDSSYTAKATFNFSTDVYTTTYTRMN